MKQYLLLPEDSISVLPEEDGAETAVSVFCERTLIVFPCSGVERARMLKNVTEDRMHAVDCLELTARDALFDTRQVILVPVTRPDFACFYDALQKACPTLLTEITEAPYEKQTCDQTGSHLHRHA